jgi:hypothetical protein
MPILLDSELEIYAPSLTEEQAKAVMPLALLIAQGPSGSNCFIEKQVRKEQRTVKATLQTVQLSYWPVSLSDPIVIEGRTGNVRNRFRRAVGVSNWNVIGSGAYVLDDTGHLSFNTGSSIYGFNRDSVGSCINEIKIQYTAGIDFTVDTPESVELKTALGAMLIALSSNSIDFYTGQQITKKESYLEVAETYAYPQATERNRGGISTPNGIPDYLLAPFRKYMPRGFY